MANNSKADAPRVTEPQKGKATRAPPPALNPESCALVQPYKDFVSKGFIQALRVEFTPLGVRIACSVRADLRKPEEDKNTEIAIGDAKSRIIEKNLWTPGNRGSEKAKEQKQTPPKKSLVKEDFLKSDQYLLDRAKAVAEALNDTTARGRIGSLNLMVEGVDTFEEWWKSAAPTEKSRLLMDKKHHETLIDAEHVKLSELMKVCPFRGPVPTHTSEEEETEQKPKEGSPKTSQALVPQKKKGSPSKK